MATRSNLMKCLACVGSALQHHGLRSLAGIVPLHEELPDIARDAWVEWIKLAPKGRLVVKAVESGSKPALDIEKTVDALAGEVFPDLPADVRAALAAYLVQVHTLVQQRRADTGKTSLTLSRATADDLLALLPRAWPRPVLWKCRIWKSEGEYYLFDIDTLWCPVAPVTDPNQQFKAATKHLYDFYKVKSVAVSQDPRLMLVKGRCRVDKRDRDYYLVERGPRFSRVVRVDFTKWSAELIENTRLQMLDPPLADPACSDEGDAEEP